MAACLSVQEADSGIKGPICLEHSLENIKNVSVHFPILHRIAKITLASL
jgi:hypothetical protein